MVLRVVVITAMNGFLRIRAFPYLGTHCCTVGSKHEGFKGEIKGVRAPKLACV